MGSVDVVIVAFNSQGVIKDCLAACRQLRHLGHIVVVDHGTDGAGDVAEQLGATTLRDAGNPGFGAGQNRGVSASTASYVLLLNPDARIEPAAVARGVAILDRSPDVAAVQGAIFSERTGLPERSQGIELGPVHLIGRAVDARRLLKHRAVRHVARLIPTVSDHAVRLPDKDWQVESLAATAILVRRTAFDSVGGFDESYFLYGEDLDLCRRLRQAGWKLVAIPDRWAMHENGGSSASAWRRELEWWRGTMSFAARWWTPRQWAVALGAALVRALRLGVVRPRHAARVWAKLIREPLAERRGLSSAGFPAWP